MEEYIRERAKHRAIAVYTFNSINCNGETQIKTARLKESLKLTLAHFNANIDGREVESVIEGVDKFQKQALELEEFCEVFEKLFSILMEYEQVK
jgi:Ca2+-binding EF-hand superfamily protein